MQARGRPARAGRSACTATRPRRSASPGPARNYVLTTGTGSGKSLAYIVPIVDHVLRHGAGPGHPGDRRLPDERAGQQPARRAGRSSSATATRTAAAPVTLRPLHRPGERRGAAARSCQPAGHPAHQLRDAGADPHPAAGAARWSTRRQGLQFLVLDELHTYRGRQGADVALLVRRVRDALRRRRGSSASARRRRWPARAASTSSRPQVAGVASLLFGATVAPERRHRRDAAAGHARRATSTDPAFVAALRDRVADPAAAPPTTSTAFVADPLSVWIEATFGVRAEPTAAGWSGPRPAAIDGRGRGGRASCAELTGVPTETLRRRRSRTACWPATRCERPGRPGCPPFAFRLHQFISRGDTVYASLEPEADALPHRPGPAVRPRRPRRGPAPAGVLPRVRPGVLLRPTRRRRTTGGRASSPARPRRPRGDDEGERRASSTSARTSPWPDDDGRACSTASPTTGSRSTAGRPRVKPSRRKHLPQPVRVGPDGASATTAGSTCHFVAGAVPLLPALRGRLRRPAAVATSASWRRSARRAAARRRRSSAWRRSAACAATRRSSPTARKLL